MKNQQNETSTQVNIMLYCRYVQDDIDLSDPVYAQFRQIFETFKVRTQSFIFIQQQYYFKCGILCQNLIKGDIQIEIAEDSTHPVYDLLAPSRFYL